MYQKNLKSPQSQQERCFARYPHLKLVFEIQAANYPSVNGKKDREAST